MNGPTRESPHATHRLGPWRFARSYHERNSALAQSVGVILRALCTAIEPLTSLTGYFRFIERDVATARGWEPPAKHATKRVTVMRRSVAKSLKPQIVLVGGTLVHSVMLSIDQIGRPLRIAMFM